ncbi:MAG: HD domain-containing protein [Spirochaetales bacterium]|nr:HD domain-containing protein [Spirochaetales bacterium]
MIFTNPLDEKSLKKRMWPRDEDLRGHYFRDTTAIIHSYPFRRLKHKTQVFFSPKNDHICTRIEHVMHVATIAATICRALELDGDLAWAIGLGHDLGHTPFGHLGETIISGILKDRGGFRHEMYSLRVVDNLANYGKGLNLTFAVRDGIINHCGEKFEKSVKPDFSIRDLASIKNRDFYPCTWEGCVVRMSDKIAYLGRDLEDALNLKLIQKDQIPGIVSASLGRNNGEIIETLVSDCIAYSPANKCIGFSDQIFEAVLVLKDFNYKNIYLNPVLANYHRNFERILLGLYDYLNDIFSHYRLDLDKYSIERNFLSQKFADYVDKMRRFYEDVDGSWDNVIIDYIAGMTDDYAIECINDIMIPKGFDTQLYFSEIQPESAKKNKANYSGDRNLDLFPY